MELGSESTTAPSTTKESYSVETKAVVIKEVKQLKE
jgi:hypothetical protein